MAQQHTIAVIAPTPYFSNRGCHIRIANEIKLLKQLGHRVNLFTYHLGEDIIGTVRADTVYRIAPVRWYTKTSAGFAIGKLWLDWKLYLLAKRTIRAAEPNRPYTIIHSHLQEGAFIGWLLKRKFALPLINDLQDDITQQLGDAFFLFRLRPIQSLLRRIERWLVARADVRFASTQKVAERFSAIQLLDYPDWLGTDAQPLNDIESTNSRNESIVYTGGFSPAKGLGILLEAYAIAKQRGLTTPLIVAGDGNIDWLKDMIAQHDLTESVSVISPLPFSNLQNTLHNHLFAVEPKAVASSEGSGKIGYYQLAGLPVVAFSSESAPVPQAVYVVGQHNAEVLADALITLNNAPDKIQQMRNALQAKPIQTWTSQLQLIEHAYDI